jgi:crotonobetainyl-CoA:carnitine CoA-transferase CaiB-like acyl-CoA transferase
MSQPTNQPGSQAAGGALEGLVIADFSRVLAGPYATMLLADLGAEVIKIERPGVGDDTRGWGPPFTTDGGTTYFDAVNRNKRSVVLDLREESDRRVAWQIATEADVVVENFLPGTMDRFGLGYDDLATANPGLVYATITGFGQQSPLPGYDLLVQAVGGLMSITGPDASQPTKVGVALVDVITGLHATAGILAAVRHRERTGEGQRVDVNLMSSLLSALTNQASAYLGAGAVPTAMGNRHPSIAPYELFQASDRPLVLAVGNDGQFRALVDVLGEPGLAADPRFATNEARVAHREALGERLTTLLSADTARGWFDRLSARGVPCGPLNDLAGAFDLGADLGLEPVVAISDPRRDTTTPQVANPIRLSATPAQYRNASPRLGEDTAAVVAMLTTPASRLTPAGETLRLAWTSLY